MTTPKRAWSIWILANAATIALIPLYANWLLRVVRADHMTWSTDADSPGLPIGRIAIFVILMLPIINVALWVVLRRYPGAVEALPRLRADGRHMLVEIVTIGLGALLGFVLVDSAMAFDWEFFLPALVWLYVVLNVRGIMHARVDSPKGRALKQRERLGGVET
jgi:hypothetical protein